MVKSNKRIKFKKSYKKFRINRYGKAKLLYKLHYKSKFLSKVKKIVDDLIVYKSDLLLHNEKLPIKNTYTNKFIFSHAIIGKSLNKKLHNNKIFKSIKTGRLSLINKNPVLNPKLSKFIITTKRAITPVEQNKRNTILHYHLFYRVFNELTEELFGFKNNRSLNLLNKKIRKKFKKSFKQSRATAAYLLQKKLLRKSINNFKEELRNNFFLEVKQLLQSRKEINKQVFTLTQAQLINCNSYLGSNSAYINSAIKPFLLGRKNGFYIINLSFTYLQFKVLINLLIGIISNRGKILIVNEKDLFDLNLVLNYKNIFYCDKGWVGGALTNHRVVRLCDKFNQRNYAKNTLLTMKTMPSLVFLLDPNLSISAMFEGYNLHIPISAIVNTDCLFFDSINYPIIGNNQAFECVYLYIHILKNAIKLGIQKEYRKVLQIR